MFEKMKKKGKEKDMDELHKSAKMDAVSEMRDMAAEAMKGKLDGLKKVSVASDSKEGLQKGLEKAKELVNKGPMAEEAAAEGESEEQEAAEQEAAPGAESKEELMAEVERKLKELEELKAKLMKA